MKAIRIVALGAALAIGAGSAVELQAQATPAPQAGAERGAKARGERGQMQGRQLGGLFRDIDLSDAQKAELKAIHERYQPQMQALRPQGPRVRGDSAARPDSATRVRMQELMTRRQADIRGVLTAGQQTTFDRNVAQMKERGERRGKEMGARKGGKRDGARRGQRSGN